MRVQETNEQLNDLNKLLTTMNEHKARFAKAIDKKVLDDVKKAMNQPGGACQQTQRDILNYITMFATNSPDARYDQQGAAIFESPEQFSQAVKRADPSAQEKQWIQKVAQEVNMDTDQKKGALLAAVSNAGTA